jgi:excinuclease ABC subunit B
VLVGINLLREGLDLPEVSLVAILDADKAGFLRSGTSLIQTIGRAARNVNARVVLYADTVTPAMRQAIDETQRRREKQLAFNAEHNITPTTIKKEIRRAIEFELRAYKTQREAVGAEEQEFDREELIVELKKQMYEAAEALEFEKAAKLRDKVKRFEAAPKGGKVRRSEVEGGDAEGEAVAPGAPGSRPKKRRKSKSKAPH